MKSSPLLSIGIIFKNEARCIERCLKSLEPLRRAIPCEVIMADTGAEDGSREIAQQYADLVFNFPWIDDFSAARNSVMDRCNGKWFFFIDCDEWLDPDVSELAAFVKSSRKGQPDFGFVFQRNYASPELEQSERFNDFSALRLARMSTGSRFHGAIHEALAYQEPVQGLTRTILHHDGYCLADPKAQKDKSKRNIKLLREKLSKDPNSLITLLQCIESEYRNAERTQYIRTATELIQNKTGEPVRFAPIILAHSIGNALRLEMPELEDWIALAQRDFPDSVFTMVDVNYNAFMAAYDHEEWDKAVQYGEAYREGLNARRNASHQILMELSTGSLRTGDALAERTVLIGLANAYLQSGKGEKALELLARLDNEKLDPGQVRNVVVALCQIHAQTKLDVSPALIRLYDQLDQEGTAEQKQLTRLAAFGEIAAIAFTEASREEEKEHDGYWRPAYTAFQCLADRCEAGRGAAILQSDDPAEMRRWLLQVEDWQRLPIEALEHAIRAGVAFPLAEKPLGVEILDGLAARLTHGENLARQMALEPSGSVEDSFWEQSLVLAALHSFDWTQGKYSKPTSPFFCPPKPEKEPKPDKRPKDTPETGLVLLRRFTQVESNLLPRLYAAPMLTEENAALLPPMHRWGLYLLRALQALDDGRPQEYLATLRKGLTACPGQKEIVQFLLDCFRGDTRPQASPELLELAEKIRTILSAYSPNDPAVAAIRQSPAYQQVAWLIEDSPSRLLQ